MLRVVYLALNKDYLLNGNFGHDYNAFCGFYLEIIVANSFFDAARYVVRGSMTQPARGSGDEVYAGINWDLYTFGNKQIWKINLMLILFIFRTNENVLPEVYHSDNPYSLVPLVAQSTWYRFMCL